MPQRTDAYCIRCGGVRDHKVRREQRAYPRDAEGRRCYESHFIVECSGCGNITYKLYRVTLNNKGTIVPGSRETHYYPAPIFRHPPHWLPTLSKKSKCGQVGELLKEIYRVLQTNSPRLATMGIRALLEHLMIVSVGDKGSFSANLKAFAAKGFITKAQQEILKAVLEAGHAAMHRAYAPEQDDLVTCMDITEHLLESLYVYPDRAKALRRTIPKRR